MRSITLTLLILLCPVLALAQDNYGFPYGKITFSELDMTMPADTSADAFVIKEVAEAHIDYESFNRLIFTYHAKIKILNQNAATRADIRIPLIRGSEKTRVETIRSVQASAFNIVQNKIQESKMDPKSVFVDKSVGRTFDLASFAIPDVKAGTVIEYQYVIESPFLFNFRKWEFQSDIPKIYSEYWTVIPANYNYNITLRGYLSLTSKIDNVVNRCLVDGAGATADCTSTRYIMKDIPAFKEEEFMTAKENYMSAINFQLSEIRFFDGRVDKVTKEWKDADEELKLADNFGQQLRKGKDVVDGYLDASVLSEPRSTNESKKNI